MGFLYRSVCYAIFSVYIDVTNNAQNNNMMRFAGLNLISGFGSGSVLGMFYRGDKDLTFFIYIVYTISRSKVI